MNDETLKEILDFDPLAAAEKLTGKSYKTSEPTMALGFLAHLSHGERKKAALAEQDDTQFSNTVENYTRIIREEGFEKVLDIPFAGRFVEWRDPPQESYQIWFHPDGLLLAFDTYRTDHINGAKFYFNVRFDDPNLRWSLRCSSSCAKSDISVLVGDFDAREAVRFHIRQLRTAGQLLNPWAEQPFLWLLHHMDTEDKNYDYKTINAERIAMLPEHVRTAIGVEVTV
jgi:hypothetical protein